jgi:hypothetical protein
MLFFLSLFSIYNKQKLGYCIERKVKGKTTYVPLEVQPIDGEVLTFHRQYMKLKANPEGYQSRVTWVSKIPNVEHDRMLHVCLYEYKGSFPGLRPHGNSQKPDSFYTKTPGAVMDNIAALNKVLPGPETIYRKMNKEEKFQNRAKDTKQIRNKKCYEKRREHLKENPSTFRKNFADNVQLLENMTHTHKGYVRQVIKYSDASPSAILYTDHQINDVKRFCAGKPGMVLGTDKTFNLTDLHVTATVFKHLAVVRRETGDHPLFLGPAFIHGHSTEFVYNSFFSQLACEFEGRNFDASKLVIGSDDEKVLTKAIERNFPGHHNLCTRHLRENISRKLGS